MEIKVISHRDEVMQRVQDATIRGLTAVGMQCEGYAKMICPVDTGNLRNSITNTMDGDDTVVVGTNVEYAPYVEYGTSRTKAQPYLVPAVENHKKEYGEILASFLKDA